MSAVATPTRAPQRPAVNRDGHHWEQHGVAVAVARQGVLDASTTCVMAAHSIVHPRIMNGQAHVLMEVSKDPFTMAARMTSLEARRLAAALVQSADRVDEVCAQLSKRGAKP